MEPDTGHLHSNINLYFINTNLKKVNQTTLHPIITLCISFFLIAVGLILFISSNFLLIGIFFSFFLYELIYTFVKKSSVVKNEEKLCIIGMGYVGPLLSSLEEI